MGALARGRGEVSLASLAAPSDFVDGAGMLVGLEHKRGILVTEGKPEASPAFELLETRTDRWLSFPGRMTDRASLRQAAGCRPRLHRW